MFQKQFKCFKIFTHSGAAVEEAKKARVEGAERSGLLEELGVKEKMLAAVTSEVLKYKECDPEILG